MFWFVFGGFLQVADGSHPWKLLEIRGVRKTLVMLFSCPDVKKVKRLKASLTQVTQ